MIPMTNAYREELTSESMERVSSFKGDAGELYTLPEAAAILRITRRTLQRWLKSGTISGVKLAGSRWRFRGDELKRLLDGGGTDDQ